MAKKVNKRKKLLVTLYTSGYIGKGKGKTRIVYSTLTPSQYQRRYYSSDEHFNTEYAMEVKRIY